MVMTRQGKIRSEEEEAEHMVLCDALWDAMPEDYKQRAVDRCGRVYFCDGVTAAMQALQEGKT